MQMPQHIVCADDADEVPMLIDNSRWPQVSPTCPARRPSVAAAGPVRRPGH